jgi:hypothetical protein
VVRIHQKKENEMKRQLLIFTLLLTSISSYATDTIKEGQQYPIDKMKKQIKQIIKMTVTEVSKGLPQKVDKYTEVTKIRDENLTLIYTFEINTGAKSDESVKKEDKARMEKPVSQGICQSAKRFLDAGVTLSYEYFSKSTQAKLFTFTLDKKKCKELHYD